MLLRNAGRCHFVRDSANSAASQYRALSDSTVTAEQPWSKHDRGLLPDRRLRSAATPAAVDGARRPWSRSAARLRAVTWLVAFRSPIPFVLLRGILRRSETVIRGHAHGPPGPVGGRNQGDAEDSELYLDTQADPGQRGSDSASSSCHQAARSVLEDHRHRQRCDCQRTASWSWVPLATFSVKRDSQRAYSAATRPARNWTSSAPPRRPCGLAKADSRPSPWDRGDRANSR